jgi:hypothetical protein
VRCYDAAMNTPFEYYAVLKIRALVCAVGWQESNLQLAD